MKIQFGNEMKVVHLGLAAQSGIVLAKDVELMIIFMMILMFKSYRNIIQQNFR